MFELLAVEPFVVDPNAMAAAVTSAFTFGRVALIFGLVAVGLGLFFKDQLAAAWAEASAKAAAKVPLTNPQAKAGTAGTVTFNVVTSATPDDDLSQGIAFLRSLHSIYKKQGMPQSELNARFLDGVELLLPKVAPTPSLGETLAAAKGGAA